MRVDVPATEYLATLVLKILKHYRWPVGGFWRRTAGLSGLLRTRKPSEQATAAKSLRARPKHPVSAKLSAYDSGTYENRIRP
jgi:hypothetical protein